MRAPTVSIIVPTYCEAVNLPMLVSRIYAATCDAGLEPEIIIVDDNSPDDTRRVCAELSQRYPVRLHVRENQRGLSSAVLTGIGLARSDVYVVMDADLSHPPEKIGELVDALDEQGADFVIGSRYAAGGKTDEDWGWFRRLNSLIATWLALPLINIKDPMAGFFAIRRSTFESAVKLDPIGYKIGLELLVKCGCRNVIEVPIEFTDRRQGQSKLSWKEQFNYLRHLKRLYDYRFSNWAYLGQFVVVGTSGMIVDLLAFIVLLNWMATPVARAVAIGIAMSWNFVLNRNLTFSYARGEPILPQYFGFCVSCLVGATVNWLVSVSLWKFSPPFADHQWAAALIGIVAGTIFNFSLCRFLVFRSRQHGNGPGRALI